MHNTDQIPLIQPTYSPPKLKTLPLKEKPAYRVATDADTCNLAELLAVIVGGSKQIEVSERLLTKFGSIRQLAQSHVNEIAGVKGVGPQTALRLKAALALGRKLLDPEDPRPVIHHPSDAAQILMPRLAHRGREYLVVLVLDTKNTVLSTVEIYHGTLNSAPIRVAELFRPAIQQNGAAIIMAHNHPSSDPTPSPEDIRLTESVVRAGKLMDINLLDHIVIGNERWISLREKKLGFS